MQRRFRSLILWSYLLYFIPVRLKIHQTWQNTKGVIAGTEQTEKTWCKIVPSSGDIWVCVIKVQAMLLHPLDQIVFTAEKTSRFPTIGKECKCLVQLIYYNQGRFIQLHDRLQVDKVSRQQQQQNSYTLRHPFYVCLGFKSHGTLHAIAKHFLLMMWHLIMLLDNTI